MDERMDDGMVTNVPDGLVAVRHGMDINEGKIVLGLLTSSGIAAALKPAEHQPMPSPWYPVRAVDLLVDEARVDEVEALLTTTE